MLRRMMLKINEHNMYKKKKYYLIIHELYKWNDLKRKFLFITERREKKIKRKN